MRLNYPKAISKGTPQNSTTNRAAATSAVGSSRSRTPSRLPRSGSHHLQGASPPAANFTTSQYLLPSGARKWEPCALPLKTCGPCDHIAGSSANDAAENQKCLPRACQQSRGRSRSASTSTWASDWPNANYPGLFSQGILGNMVFSFQMSEAQKVTPG